MAPEYPHDLPPWALDQIPMLAGLSEDERRELLAEVELVHLTAGDVLCRQGEPGESAYLVLNGRLEAVVEEDGEGRVVGEIHHGEPVGELSLLTAEPRSATVRALRDTELLHLPREHFDRLLEEHPTTGATLVRQLARRLRSSQRPGASHAGVRTITLVPAGTEHVPAEFVRSLVAALEERGPTLHLTAERLDDILGEGAAESAPGQAEDRRIARWLNRQELEHASVVLQARRASDAWTRRCLRLADRVLVLARSVSEPVLGETASALAEAAQRSERVTHELVLLHPPATTRVTGTKAWLALHPFGRHHHVRFRVQRDLGRLVRHLTGTSVGLALGGGGARGFAHIGVLRALDEAGIAVDRIGGTSMGSVIAAQVAWGYPTEDLVRLNRLWKKHRVHRGFTFPLVSFITGLRGQAMLKEMFGDERIEDLWMPFACVASNLTTSRVQVLDRGLLEAALGASISLPGIAPPRVYRNGELLVDGAVLDNLPVGPVGELGEGPLMAVEVSPRVELRADPSYGATPSAGRVLLDRLGVGRRVEEPFPGLVRILQRSLVLASMERTRRVREEVDLVFAPPVGHFEIFGWDRICDIERTGYQYALDRLERAEAEGRPPFGPAGHV